MNVNDAIPMIKGLTNAELVRDGADYHSDRLCARFGRGIVVNGSLVPQVAKSFKAAGITLRTLRHSEDGTLAVWTLCFGKRVYLYRSATMNDFGNEYINRRARTLTGLRKLIADWFVSKLKV